MQPFICTTSSGNALRDIGYASRAVPYPEASTSCFRMQRALGPRSLDKPAAPWLKHVAKTFTTKMRQNGKPHSSDAHVQPIFTLR